MSKARRAPRRRKRKFEELDLESVYEERPSIKIRVLQKLNQAYWWAVKKLF